MRYQYAVSIHFLSVIGAFVIILDPIFQGLAVSLLFGVGASTLLTLLVIPVLCYHLIGSEQLFALSRTDKGGVL